MTIYGRFGHTLTITRYATLEDIGRLEKRKPDKQDREAVKNGSYVLVCYADDGQEDIVHQAYMRADDGCREIFAALEATAPAKLEIFDEDGDKWQRYEVAMLGLDPSTSLDMAAVSAALRARGWQIVRGEQIDDQITVCVRALGKGAH